MNTSLRGLQEKWKKRKELRKDRNGRIRGSQPLRSETEKYSIPRRLTCSSSVPHIGWLQKLFRKVVMTESTLKAVKIPEAYEGTLKDDFPPDNECCEHGEMLRYKWMQKIGYFSSSSYDSESWTCHLFIQISLLEESGSLGRALDELHKKELKIVDKLAYKEQEVSLLVKLGRFEEGATFYTALLAMNLDNCRIPLHFLQGDKFREAADNYIRLLLTKADILEQLILALEHSVRTTGRSPGREDREAPSTLMWALFLSAQHYDKRGQYDLSLSKIDEAIEHTPTVIDLYSAKSQILKNDTGDLAAAALADMDLADRYINSECVKRCFLWTFYG